MNGLVFYIGLGLGLAAACGLRPFLPLLLAGALASSDALGVTFAKGAYTFLESDWWLLAVTVALVLAYALQLVFRLAPVVAPEGAPATSSPWLAALTTLGIAGQRRRGDVLASAIAGLGLGAGMLLFAGTLDAHGDASWPGLIGGGLAALTGQAASAPIVARARKRLPDRGAREALTVYLDAASLLVAALTALLHPLGYVFVVVLAWFALRLRSRGGEKYAGLRILRR